MARVSERNHEHLIKEAIALKLMRYIGSQEDEAEQEDEAYWLELYRQCLRVVNGRRPVPAVKVKPLEAEDSSLALAAPPEPPAPPALPSLAIDIPQAELTIPPSKGETTMADATDPTTETACKESVALQLMLHIGAQEEDKEGKDDRDYWLELYRQCLRVTNGRRPSPPVKPAEVEDGGNVE